MTDNATQIALALIAALVSLGLKWLDGRRDHADHDDHDDHDDLGDLGDYSGDDQL